MDKVRWTYTTDANTVVDNDFLDSELAVEEVKRSDSTKSREQQCASTPSSQTVQSLTKAAQTLTIAARDLTAAVEALKTV